MIDGGEDPKFIARRMFIAASEDIGNADPTALLVAEAAFRSAEVIGYPECRINLAQAAVYLALAPKSNAAEAGIDAALREVRNGPARAVPDHLRDRHRPGGRRITASTNILMRIRAVGSSSSISPTALSADASTDRAIGDGRRIAATPPHAIGLRRAFASASTGRGRSALRAAAGEGFLGARRIARRALRMCVEAVCDDASSTRFRDGAHLRW